MRSKPRRYYGAGDLHFITCSCYRRKILLGTAPRRNLFLRVLEQVRRRYQFVVIGYVIMGARTSSDQRTAGEKPVDGDAGAQTRLRTTSFGGGETKTPFGAGPSVRLRSATYLAETLLRFQRVDGAKTHREAALYASQSGEARTGFFAGTLEVEQLSCLRSWESGMVKVNDSEVLRMKVRRSPA